MDGEDKVIRELGKGAAVGELALITGEARAASIRAARDCELVQIGQASFQRLLASSLELSRALNLQLARQLEESEGVKFAARPLASPIPRSSRSSRDDASTRSCSVTGVSRPFALVAVVLILIAATSAST